MKVFLSWSGDQSRELAEALREWLPAVLQSVKPYFTPNDVEKGARWGQDIALELDQSAVGIFCLTKENLDRPWIMFEAGALSKHVDTSRVCPVLFGIESTDLKGPLVQFQASPFSESEMKKLVGVLNSSLGEQRLNDAVLNNVFAMWWPKLQEQVARIMDKYKGVAKGATGKRTDRELLEEVLELARLNASSRPVKRHSPDDAGAFKYSIENIGRVVELLIKMDMEGVVKDMGKVFAPLKYLVTNGNAYLRNDEELQSECARVEKLLEKYM